MKKVLLIGMLLTVALGSQLNAQDYKTAIGGRLGPSYGFTIKHFFSEKFAFEGLVTSRYFGRAGLAGLGHWSSTPGVNVTGLVQWHFPIGNIEGFKWFIGGGAHIGVWGGYNTHPYFSTDRAYFLVGLDAVGGIEYTFSNIPLTLQVDIKPSFNFFEYLGILYDEVAISARYTF